MKVLLTGASGFLGKCILQSLSINQNVHTLGRSECDYSTDLSKDIPKFESSFDLVIHAAGKAHLTPKTKDERDSFFLTNLKGTQFLLKGLERVGLPKQFVFISSVSVYGISEGILINEDSPLIASDPYGKSKIQAEMLVIDWCLKNCVICTILRLPLIVGDNPPGNLSAMIKGIARGYYYNIGGGYAKKSMVLGEDIAKHIIVAAKVGGIYNLTDGYHPSFYELSHHIGNQLYKRKVPNISFSIAKLIAKAGDLLGEKFPINSDKLSKITSTLTFDDSKARRAFGWNPTPVLQGFKIS